MTQDLLTPLNFFLIADFVVIVLVGIYLFKARREGGTTEQLLAEIRDILRNQNKGCQEEKKIEELEVQPEQKSNIYYEIEEGKTTSEGEGISELSLVKNVLKTDFKLQPRLEIPKPIDDLLKKTHYHQETQKVETTKTEAPILPPPPPPPPTEEEKGD